MALTDVKARNAKPRAKSYKLADGGGTVSVGRPEGREVLAIEYRFERERESALAFGIYPEVSLAEAREKREAARKQLASGIDPGAGQEGTEGGEGGRDEKRI